jgi:hypothetical protein
MAIGNAQASINSVYVALTPAGGAESVLTTGTNFFVVVKAEAGDAIVNLGATYKLHVLLQDVTNFTNVLNQVVTGNLSDAAWPLAEEDTTFVFPMNGIPVIAGAADTIYKILAVLAVGVKETGTQSVESSPILVTA